MNVLLVLEDFRGDQYVVKPIIEQLLSHLGKPNAKVRVCYDPRIGGVSEALKWSVIQQVLSRYRGMVQLFILVVDRDGNADRQARLRELELQAKGFTGGGAGFFGENAWQEIEVWALAGQTRLPSSWNWQAIREAPHPKETYFEPWAMERGLESEPGQGRKTMGLEAARNYRRVRSLCPEDIAALESRVSEWLASMAVPREP